MEAATKNLPPRQTANPHRHSELLLWSAPSREELAPVLATITQALVQGDRPELYDLAYALHQRFSNQRPTSSIHLAIVAASLEDLRQKLAQAHTALRTAGTVQIHDPSGIYYTEAPLAREGRVAFLFPGQGSQYPHMLHDLAVAFPEIRKTFERADRLLADRLHQPLSRYVFPVRAGSPEGEQAQREMLAQTSVAQPALGAASMALFWLIRAFGVRPDMVAGHSYGEYVALCAAGALDEESLIILSEERGRCIMAAVQDEPGTMAAVQARPEAITPVLKVVDGVWLANLNGPDQTVIAGTRASVAQAVEQLQARGLSAQPIAVACAFHSPLVAPAQQRLAEVLARMTFAAPTAEVFSNSTAAPYPQEPHAIAALLAEHLVRPVRFSDELEAMYAAGARIFVEIGPRSVLTNLTHQILDQRPHLAVALDLPRRRGFTQLQHVLGQLIAHGVPTQLDRLF